MSQKDPMVSFRSVIVGKNRKGGDRFQLYLTSEAAKNLAGILTEGLTHQPGLKIDLHIAERSTDDGRKFNAAFAFVKEVQSKTAGAGAAPTFAATKESFTAKAKIADLEKDVG